MSSITRLGSYVCGKWQAGDGDQEILVNPTTEEAIAETSTSGVDMGAALEHARTVGCAALGELTFAQRGEMLKAISSAIYDHREELLKLSTLSGGTTRSDGKFDIDGATATLSYYAKLGEKLGDTRLLLDGDGTQLSRSPRYVGRHVYTPMGGVAVHINAFNFPAWGMGEKAAVALLAGAPVVSKPATSTAWVSHRIAEIIVDSKILPEGAFTFLCGGAGDLLDHVDWRDAIAFTGSSTTGLKIRSHQNVLANNVRVNIEADSLNAAVLGADIDRDADAYDLFLREVVRDITQKAGQKCTAIRRIMVAPQHLEYVRDDLVEQIKAMKVGNPGATGVKVGPLATERQYKSVTEEIEQLKSGAEVLCGGGERGTLVDIDNDKGFFVAPTLLFANDGTQAAAVHDRECFGPVATLMTYDGSAAQASELVVRGKGSLVSSVYTDDADFCADMVRGCGPALGRMHVGSSKIAEHSPGPGTVMPMMVHGGPGRAGGGEELGGTRGMALYQQRTAVQGFQPWLEKLS